MSTAPGHSPSRSLLVLLAGVLVGGLTTTALVLVIVNIVGGGPPPAALEAPVFVDESDTDGIDQVYTGEFQFFVGGGVAVFDCNSDLLPDPISTSPVGPSLPVSTSIRANPQAASNSNTPPPPRPT